MKVLFVTPIENGSGETITALHCADNLVARGDEVLFLAAPFARRFLEGRFGNQIWDLGGDGQENVRLWHRALAEYSPDAVVFADYSWLFFPQGSAPLATVEGWVESLDSVDACLVTFDHFGFAQKETRTFFGPAHLGSQFHSFPEPPPRMKIMLPCPMHEPSEVSGRRGAPFRYWQVPIVGSAELRAETRSRYLESEDDRLVFHLVSNWAWRAAEQLGLPFYQRLPQLFDRYLGGLEPPVTLVSLNNGELLAPAPGSKLRLVNLAPLPTAEFEALLQASDLVLSENGVSISLGKAVCGLTVTGVLKNSFRLLELTQRAEVDKELRHLLLEMEAIRPGAVYPFDVFPSGLADELAMEYLYRDNTIFEAFAQIEIFGGDETRQELTQLLTDPEVRSQHRERQRQYISNLGKLGDGAEVLSRLIAEDPSVPSSRKQ